MSWSQSDFNHIYSLSVQRDSVQSPPFAPNPPPPSPSPSSNGKTSPAILFIIVVLAVIFFISGLLHLLARFIIKHRYSSSNSQSNHQNPDGSDSETYQRQLQQLFNQHDSGLDQAFIEALPVFQYKEIVGLKEPFDCAVCLCEFSDQDKLRLLPPCSHAFHIDCIDTWLLSNSTCPLCRAALCTSDLSVENPVFDFDDWREEDGLGGLSFRGGGDGEMVFHVRLGKFRSSNDEAQNGVRSEVKSRENGETSSSNLDARRCFSMGSYQYVVADSELQVALSSNPVTDKGRDANGDCKGKKINIASKNESFSVSKIWLWSKKDKFPASSNGHTGDDISVDMRLPWNNAA